MTLTTSKAMLSHDRVLPHRMRLLECPIRDLCDTGEHRFHAHFLRRRPWVRTRRSCTVVYR